MTAHENEPADDTGDDTTDDEQQATTDMPEVTEEHREKAREMMVAYEDRPTAVLPGAGKTVTGTAVNEWLDDEGNPKFGQDKPEDEPDNQPEDQAEVG